MLSFKYLKMQTTATPGTRGFNVPEQKGHASWNIFFFISKHAPDHVNPFRPSQVISIDLTEKKIDFFQKKKGGTRAADQTADSTPQGIRLLRAAHFFIFFSTPPTCK